MREKSSNSAEIRLFKIDREEVLNFLRSYAKKLVDEGKAELVILIGSLAKGNYTAFSDADILIVAENVPKIPLNRISMYIEPRSPLDIEPRVLTKEEFYKIALEKRMLFREVLDYGIILDGDIKILEEAKAFYLKNKPQAYR